MMRERRMNWMILMEKANDTMTQTHQILTRFFLWSVGFDVVSEMGKGDNALAHQINELCLFWKIMSKLSWLINMTHPHLANKDCNQPYRPH